MKNSLYVRSYSLLIYSCFSGLKTNMACKPWCNYSFSDIDECLTSPCQNGGTCTNKENGYTCDCVDGYKGDNCERGGSLIIWPIQRLRGF